MSVFIGYPSFMAYQMMKGKKGNNDGFPSIPGMIARYSALGLTNEQMAANPVWVDKTGNGHDIQMKNFAWGGMSGVGGYKYNFLSNDWSADVNQVSVVLSHKIVIINKRTSIQFVKLIRNELENTINITLKITGLEANGSSFKIYDNVGSSHAQEYNKDGIYQINYTATEGANRIYFYVLGGNMGQLENPITIEQLPLYPGALVFDGVDDYGTCNNFPILTKEKGYTVVALRQYLVEKSTAYLTANGDSISNTSFIFEGNNYKDTWNFGKATGIQASRILATQTSKQYDGIKLNIGTNTEGSNLLQVGKWSKSYSNVAIWELVFLDHDATEEELTKIKDYFVKTYPWLFPDQAWTVTGKTNEDEDRATIANITGNGNDLILSNFGFAEGSGYNEEGEYAGYLVTDGVDDIASSNTIIYEADFTFIGEWKFIQKDDTVAGINSSSHLYIQNRYNRGATVMINSTFENKKNITDYMTFKAITSKGKAYDENWNEVDLLYGDGNKGPSGVNIGGQGYTEFCHMIFKNMALYMNKVFSKDDCIKAYNYLQTLKAK